MLDAALRKLGGAGEVVGLFVTSFFENQTLAADVPATVNLETALTGFLCERGVHQRNATEFVEKQRSLLIRRVTEVIDRWVNLGIAAPVQLLQSGSTVISWKHDRYFELTGHRPISDAFLRIHEWVASKREREFLLPCICFLKIIGCDPIFVTDGPGDEGIDCIGRIQAGPMRSSIIFLQAKTKAHSDSVSRDEVLQEYGKYAAFPKSKKYTSYLAALKIDKSADGSNFSYVIVANTDFGTGAQEMASRLGVLLRSSKQLAYFLSQRTSIATLELLQAKKLIPRAADLDLNVSPACQLDGLAS